MYAEREGRVHRRQVQNLPPLTPQVTSVRQILFTENFRWPLRG